MPKARAIRNQDGDVYGVMIFCPGCEQGHVFTTNSPNAKHNWTFNGDMDSPTFSPSMLVNKSWPERRCHSFVRNGQIQFLGDCFHELKGQTVDLPADDW